MENSRKPIIGSPRHLSNYPYKAIQPALAEHILAIAKSNNIAFSDSNIKALECYCDITNQPLTHIYLSSNGFNNVAAGFIGAILDEDFICMTNGSRIGLAGKFMKVLDALREEIPSIEKFKNTATRNIKCSHIWSIQKQFTDNTAVEYWQGWPTTTAKGEIIFLNLCSIWETHGEAFTRDVHKRLSTIFRKEHQPRKFEISKFFKFVSDNKKIYPTHSFQDPLSTYNLVLDFMKLHFTAATQKQSSMLGPITSWNALVRLIEKAFIFTGAWAQPYEDLPRANYLGVAGAPTRHKKTSSGTVVHEKLIVPVPIQITDSQAIEVIFNRLNSDLLCVKQWATRQARKIRKNQLNRIHNAKFGSHTNGKAGVGALEEIGINNIFATFQADGFQTSKQYTTTHYGHFIERSLIAEFLGIPTHKDLFPYQCLLVLEHPQITESFLKNFKLYDDYGNISGFIKTDNGYQLTGYKLRNGPNMSEQKIMLTPRTANLVRQVIEITTPLRDYLRKKGDSRYKYLFLTASKGFSEPRPTVTSGWSKSRLEKYESVLDRVKSEFEPFTDRRDESLTQLLSRITINTLRASRGVQIYFETASVEIMAKALGHKEYKSDLLSRYLPAAVLSFFQERWIRIFQKGLICEAMKDSPYLLKATRFNSIEEFDEFMRNHALKKIPSHLSNPDNENQNIGQKNSRAYISIDQGILTALISLADAVHINTKNNKVCGIAKYWAKLTYLVMEEINHGNDFLLKEHLKAAILNSDPATMEKIIYGPAI